MKSYALICAYNEENTAVNVIGRTLKYVDKVIFVDDGSTDKTLENVQNRFGKNRNVTIITYPKNHGKGYALITGFKYFLKEKGDVLVTLDADNQHNPDEIPVVKVMVEHGYSDIVIGSRYARLKGFPRLRVLFNIFSTMVLLLTSGGFFADVASGFRCYSRHAIESILPRLNLYGFGIELETLQVAKEKELKTSTVPVSCTYDKHGEKPNFDKLAVGYARFAIKYKKEILKRIFKL
jgi:glycosyltransferase involved in cell wall biosynthesis